MSGFAETRKMLRRLRSQGYSIRLTPGGHIRIEHEDMDGPVFAASTPGDVRGVRNLRAILRRKTVVAPALLK